MGFAVIFLTLMSVAYAGDILIIRWNRDEHSYVGDIEIGEPTDQLPVKVGNEQHTFLMVNSRCANCIQPMRPYWSSRSVSFNDTMVSFNEQFEHSTAYGDLATDLVSIANTSLWVQEFGLIRGQMRSDGTPGRRFSGLLGLGPPPPWKPAVGVTNLLKKFGAAHVTFRLRIYGFAGEILLGDKKSDKCSTEVDTYKLYLYNTYIEMDELRLGDTQVGRFLSTSFSINSNFWSVPESVLPKIQKAFKADVATSQVDCNGIFPQINIVIGEKIYTIPGDHLLMTISNKCFLQVNGASESGYMVIGRSFFLHYCVGYDHEKGLLDLSKNSF